MRKSASGIIVYLALTSQVFAQDIQLPVPRYTTGWLARYASLATNASNGAVLKSQCDVCN